MATDSLHADLVADFDAQAAEALLLYPWPWNDLELERMMATLALRVRGRSTIRRHHLPPAILEALPQA